VIDPVSDSQATPNSADAARHVEELLEWLRIPSVSGYADHDDQTAAAAAWVAEKLRRAGLKVETVATDGHPLVLAETPAVPGAPVALVYGHYDVQPAEPIDLWIDPPFQPVIRDGNVYARGATDDKGQYPESIAGLRGVLTRWDKRAVNPEYDKARAAK